jgi:CheY-like chemotaxis protein
MKLIDKLDTVLVIDDEPFQAEWLTDYFIARKLNVEQCPDLQSALSALESTRYKYVVIDLSIPYAPALAQPLGTLGVEFLRYPGLLAARRARTIGHNTYQVIVYSVHDSDDVQAYVDRIRCRYILKGRPGELKSHITGTFDHKPHGWGSLRRPTDAKKVQKAKTIKPLTGAEKLIASGKLPSRRQKTLRIVARSLQRRKSK